MANTDLSTDGEEEEEEESGLAPQSRAGKTAQQKEEINTLEQELSGRVQTVGLTTDSYQPGKLLYFDEMALDFDPEQRLEYLKKIARQTPTLT